MPSPTTPEMRRAHTLRSRGSSVEQVADELGKSTTTIYRWLDRFPPVSGPAAPPEPPPLKIQTQEEAWKDAFKLGRRMAQSNATFRTMAALYWGEGNLGSEPLDPKKTEVSLASSDPDMIKVWCAWLSKEETAHEVRIRIHMDENNSTPDSVASRYWKGVVGSYFPRVKIVVDRVGEVRNTHHKSNGTAYVVLYDVTVRGKLMGGIDHIMSMV